MNISTQGDGELAPYLSATDVVDWHHPSIVTLATALANGKVSDAAISQACFEWVRDNVRHSVDYQQNPVTCRASDVLTHRTGYCFAKSHLLAALLRANGIPTGFCYQRLSIDDIGAPYCLHGFNAVYLKAFGWYRIDPRGNRTGIDAQFTPPVERLAYSPSLSGECTFSEILPAPLPIVIETLTSHDAWQAVQQDLPDKEKLVSVRATDAALSVVLSIVRNL